MLSFLNRKLSIPSTVGWTIVSRHHMPGAGDSNRIQYATDRYVVSRMDGLATVYLREHDRRYLVDPATRSLRPIDPAEHEQVHSFLAGRLASAELEWDTEPVVYAGRSCRRGTLRIGDADLVMDASILVTRVPGLDRTALAAERVHTARLQPFETPMQPDECTALLECRILARGLEHRQSIAMLRVEPGIEQLALLDEVQDFRVSK